MERHYPTTKLRNYPEIANSKETLYALEGIKKLATVTGILLLAGFSLLKGSAKSTISVLEACLKQWLILNLEISYHI